MQVMPFPEYIISHIQEASTQLERIEQDRVVKARVCAHHVTSIFTDFTHMCVCVPFSVCAHHVTSIFTDFTHMCVCVPFSVIMLASQLVCVLCLAFVGYILHTPVSQLTSYM